VSYRESDLYQSQTLCQTMMLAEIDTGKCYVVDPHDCDSPSAAGGD